MLHDLQRHRMIGQKLQRPTRPARGLGTAGDRDQPRFLFSIEHLLHAGPNLLLALQRRLQAFFHEPLTQRLDRANAGAKGLGRVPILHLRSGLRLVHRQQNVGVADAQGRPLAAANQLLQTLPFPGLQPNDVLFHVDPP